MGITNQEAGATAWSCALTCRLAVDHQDIGHFCKLHTGGILLDLLEEFSKSHLAPTERQSSWSELGCLRAIRENLWRLSSAGAHGRMLVARQKCLHTGAGSGKMRLTSSLCPTAETAHSCKDRGDGSPEPLQLPTTSSQPPRLCGYGGAWDEEQGGR